MNRDNSLFGGHSCTVDSSWPAFIKHQIHRMYMCRSAKSKYFYRHNTLS